MDLSDIGADNINGIALMNWSPWGEEMSPWAIDEENSFMDMFGIDIDTFNSIYSGAGAIDGQTG